MVEVPLTWSQFHNVLFEKYVPHTYQDIKMDEFLRPEQGDMSIAAYVSMCHALSHNALQLITLEEKRIRYIIKFLNRGL